MPCCLSLGIVGYDDVHKATEKCNIIAHTLKGCSVDLAVWNEQRQDFLGQVDVWQRWPFLQCFQVNRWQIFRNNESAIAEVSGEQCSLEGQSGNWTSGTPVHCVCRDLNKIKRRKYSRDTTACFFFLIKKSVGSSLLLWIKVLQLKRE